jgi:hypothetical protein
VSKYQYILRIKGDPSHRRWGVREAVSVSAAYHEIAHARVTGSIGGKSIVDRTHVGGGVTVISDVVQINSDGTVRLPYTLAY